MSTSANLCGCWAGPRRSSDASEELGAVCLPVSCEQEWRDHHRGTYRNRTHERARVQLFKANLVVGFVISKLGENHQGFDGVASLIGRYSCERVAGDQGGRGPLAKRVSGMHELVLSATTSIARELHAGETCGGLLQRSVTPG